MEKNIWLTSTDLMNRWGINAPTLWHYIQTKDLPAYRIGPERPPEDLRGRVNRGPGGWTWGDHPEPSTLNEVVQVLDARKFSIKNVVEFEKKHGLAAKTDVHIKEPPLAKDYEDFIRNLIVFNENDSEIKIQRSGKPAKEVISTSLGFRNEKTLGWKTFLEILQKKDHSYSVGIAHTKEYDQNRKMLNQIDTKLINFFSKEFSIQFPKGYHLYELDRSEKPGTYRFKFQIKDNVFEQKIGSKYDGLSDGKLLSEIKRLSEEFRRNNSNSKVWDDLSELAMLAKGRRILTEKELEDMIQSYRSSDLESKGGEFKPDRNERRHFEQD